MARPMVGQSIGEAYRSIRRWMRGGAPAALALIALPTIAPSVHGAPPELKDPTRPPTAYTTPQGPTESEPVEVFEWNLTATYTNRGLRRAVINGHHVTEGGKINDAEVLSIRPGRVRMREGEEEFSLSIYPDTIR